MMRRSLVLGALLACASFTGVVSAQTLEEKYNKKLEKDFVKKVSWVKSLEEAQKISKETGKPIFGYFTRSYSP